MGHLCWESPIALLSFASSMVFRIGCSKEIILGGFSKKTDTVAIWQDYMRSVARKRQNIYVTNAPSILAAYMRAYLCAGSFWFLRSIVLPCLEMRVPKSFTLGRHFILTTERYPKVNRALDLYNIAVFFSKSYCVNKSVSGLPHILCYS